MSAPTSSPASLDHLRDLGVAWMNRGHELMMQGKRVDLEASLAAYNEAIAALRQLPIGENPSWANSLGAALMNRGQLLHRLHGIEQATVALSAFDEAFALLNPLVHPPASTSASHSALQTFSPFSSPWPRRNLAGSHLNRASILLDLARPAEARTDARAALQLSAPHERAELVDADLSLKARRVLCDVLGQLMVGIGADQDSLAREASDLIDDGLALARHWTQRGAPHPRELAVRLFRFGVQLYRVHQPHFLAEFIQENLLTAGLSAEFSTPADTELHAIALAAIDSALAERPHDLEFLTIGDSASERRLAIWREITALRSRLTGR